MQSLVGRDPGIWNISLFAEAAILLVATTAFLLNNSKIVLHCSLRENEETCNRRKYIFITSLHKVNYKNTEESLSVPNNFKRKSHRQACMDNVCPRA